MCKHVLKNLIKTLAHSLQGLNYNIYKHIYKAFTSLNMVKKYIILKFIEHIPLFSGFKK